ncbi:putative isomerase [Iodidimonas gelatinilytica]|uniref:Putative isomerase n=1 Tax=Iodidimonas gelatinilytica TaxID=1236966 RepID=A0A5A7MWJ8_9PROT|nr:PhzF family phenazine biosynthesis isomerase [Iodidimonas gelatinilytica]GEQ99844.1 putative isomerase [Iodidimonas gelatinilytica]
MTRTIRIPFLQVDAFTKEPFKGNPAAVCPLDAWLPDPVLQAIARENNLSETAFFVPTDDEDADFHLRWFTSLTEVDLCGHATLASGHAILSNLRDKGKAVRFSSQAGILIVTKDGDRLSMDLPARRPRALDALPNANGAFGAKPSAFFSGGRDILALFEDAQQVRALKPDFVALKSFGKHGFIATAPGAGDCDFVSRCFFPAFGVEEDPVTGSAHCVSAPFWADRLGKSELFARQISQRGGELWLSVAEDRVHISGHCVEVIAGEMSVPESL